jgi:hypothetical protein
VRFGISERRVAAILDRQGVPPRPRGHPTRPPPPRDALASEASSPRDALAPDPAAPRRPGTRGQQPPRRLGTRPGRPRDAGTTRGQQHQVPSPL